MRVYGTTSDGKVRVAGPSGNGVGQFLWEHFDRGIQEAVEAAVAVCLMRKQSQEVMIGDSVLRLEYCSPPVSVVGWVGKQATIKHDLSIKEIEMLKLYADGLDTKQVAEAMDVSESTVRNHRQAIAEKTGIETITGAVAWAVDGGLVSPRTKKRRDS